jgi:hypothetical protein
LLLLIPIAVVVVLLSPILFPVFIVLWIISLILGTEKPKGDTVAAKNSISRFIRSFSHVLREQRGREGEYIAKLSLSS